MLDLTLLALDIVALLSLFWGLVQSCWTIPMFPSALNATITCFCRHSSSSLNGCFITTYLGYTWHGLFPSLTCKENVSSKQPKPEQNLWFYACNKVVYCEFIFISDHWIRAWIFVYMAILSTQFSLISWGLHLWIHWVVFHRGEIYLSVSSIPRKAGELQNIWHSFCLSLYLIVILHTPNWVCLFHCMLPAASLLP